MPRGCKWHFVGSYRIDPNMPGGSWIWKEYVAKDRSGWFYVKIVGEEGGCHPFTLRQLVDYYEGGARLADLRDTVTGLPGWEPLVQMVAFRMKSVA